jgi:hypothetical protein
MSGVAAKVEKEGKCKFCGAKALLLVEGEGPLEIKGPVRNIPGKYAIAHLHPICDAFKKAVLRSKPCFIVDPPVS